MFAVQNKNNFIARLLLKNGANLNLKDVDGFTALMIAIDSNDLESCKILLEFHPKIEVYIILY